MVLQTLQLVHFKNYAQAQFQFATKLNILVGDNGMGKTNVLDAIHTLCLTKSHFGIPDKQLIQHDADFFRLDGIFHKNGNTEHIVVKQAATKKKVLEQNGVPYTRLSEHIGLLPVVMLTPDDPYQLLDASEDRRRLIDLSIVQYNSAYTQDLTAYNKVLEQRNALLKQNLQGKIPAIDPTLIEIYDHELTRRADAIHAARAEWIAEVLPLFGVYYNKIAQINEGVGLVYSSSLATQNLYDDLQRTRARDFALGRTTVGIHKDDLLFTLRGQPIKRYASQGQLKSFVLALHLAAAEHLHQKTSVMPILLLDDIFDKLDPQRIKNLLTLLHESNFGQLFVTDTDPLRLLNAVAAIDNTAPTLFEIINGQAFIKK